MWKNEAEAREQIKAMVAEYYHDFKEKKTPYQEGDRITYAARVFDEKEMCALTDATLDFWLTTGRFADQFEKEFAKWIGVKFAHLVNSGSSANLIAFMALTAPELAELVAHMGQPVRELLRSKEAQYQTLGIDNPAMSDAQIFALVAQHPRLLNRPIVVTPKGAALCRPPEKVLALL